MAFEFKLPDLGEGVQEGEIVRWLVDAGDEVERDQPVVEIMTDKVTAELPAPVAGKIVQRYGDEGEVIPVGSTLVVIEEPATAPVTEREAPVSETPAVTLEGPAVAADLRQPEAVEAASNGGIPLAVPAVRRLARELGVDLHTLAGSGPGGRILEADVRAAGAREEVEAQEAPRAPEAPGVQRIPLRGLRRVIAEHMMDAQLHTAPYTYVEEADFTELVRLRERVTPMAEKAGVRVTYLPFILAAVSMALREHPYLNATVDSETGDLLLHTEQHISLAIHTEEGLVVPVIRNVEQRNLLDLAREIERLAVAAREGRLTREDYQGGTFSVTSLGPLGGVMATPVLNTPQLAVLGVHRIAARPVVREGQILSRQMANLSLTLDHRYIDGYVGARFAQTLVKYIEDPAVMLFWLSELRDGAA